MKKLLMVLLAGGLVFGCASTHESVPTAGIPFADAEYDISGDTAGEECANSIIGLYWGYLFTSDSGTMRSAGGMGLPIPSFGPFVSGPRSVALRKAMDKVPNATHATAIRANTEKKGIPFIFMNHCEKVHTRGVTMGKPHAHQK